MKKSALILSVVILSLIGLKAQENSTLIETTNTYIEEDGNKDLYISLVNDFDEWYKTGIENEKTAEEDYLDTYNSIYENFELLKDIENEKNEDSENDKLYESILFSMNGSVERSSQENDYAVAMIK